MAIRSKYDCFCRLSHILQNVDDTKKQREIKMKKWASEKVTPTREAVAELDRIDSISRKTAERSMQELRKEYTKYLQAEALPFKIKEIPKNGVPLKELVTDVSLSDMKFLDMLNHITLSPSEIEYYGQYFINENRMALARALKQKAESWGYNVSGLCPSPDEELAEFDRACFRVKMLIKPIVEWDALQQTNNAIFRDQLREMVEASQHLPQIEVTKKTETPEENIIRDMKKEKEAEEKSADDSFKEKLDFVSGFSGKEGLRDEAEIEARTRANMVHLDNLANKESVEAASPEPESEIPHSGEVWGANS